MPAFTAGYFLQLFPKKVVPFFYGYGIYIFVLFISFFYTRLVLFFAVVNGFVAANADKNIPQHPKRMLREKIGAVFFADFNRFSSTYC